MTMRLIGTPKILSPYGAGSTIWFYEPSTTTKKDVYSDASLTTPISQTSGIAADADGFWPTIYCSAALYRIIVKDSDGVTKQDEDNFDPGLAAGFGVSSVVGIAQGGTGANNAPQARLNLGAASASSLSAIQDDVTELQTQIAPGLNGSNVLGVVAALASVAPANMSSQVVLLQRVRTTTTSATTVNSAIPADGTKPQSSEGVLVFSQSFTPLSASSYIRILANLRGDVTMAGTSTVAAAAFLNNDADAIAVDAITTNVSGSLMPVRIAYQYSPGSTSAVTIKIRAGATGSGTYTINGATATFGGLLLSDLVIEEWLVKA